MFKKGTFLLSILTLLLMITSGAFAGPINHAGSDCKSFSGGDVRYNSDGTVYNFSTTSNAYVLCQTLHRDFDGFLNPGEIDSGWFNAVDLNNSQNVYCRFRGATLNADGTVHRDYGVAGQTTGFGTAKQTETLGGLHEHNESSYVNWCRIPPRTANGSSKIYTYRVNH